MTEKQYISAQQLLDDSFQLALNIFASGYRPSFIVGVWRGGAPIGIAVHELLTYLGVKTDHIAIRTSYYLDIGKRDDTVSVYGLDYLIDRVTAKDSVLLIDDVFDTGLSLQQVAQDLQQACGDNTPELKIATAYYKPTNNRSSLTPDFYVHIADQWLVFPHELQGLSVDEILHNKPGVSTLEETLIRLKASQYNNPVK